MQNTRTPCHVNETCYTRVMSHVNEITVGTRKTHVSVTCRSLWDANRVVNSGIPNDFGIPILVNPEGLRDPENMTIYLITTVRLPMKVPERISDAVVDNPNHDALTTVVKLEAHLIPCSALTFVRRTPVSIRFGQQPRGFVSHNHNFLIMCSILYF
jgi:hypothetical protein